MQQILADFGVQPVLLLAQIVNFFILLLLLKKFAYGPILKILAERKKRIEDSLKMADEIEVRLAKTELDREKKLELASKGAKNILAEAAQSAQQIVNDAHIKAAQDIGLMVAKGQEAVRQEREKMQQEVFKELSNLMTFSLRKVLAESLDKGSQRKVLEKAIKKL